MSKRGLLISIRSLYLIVSSFLVKKGKPISSIHPFKVNTLEGDVFDFASLQGKKILIVNTASKCGFTPQFKELENLYLKYKNQNFIVIGFPCNQFGNQDPGTSSEIKAFCTKNYGVSFPITEKVDVKGKHICELYDWLTSKQKNGVMSSFVIWNFQKYLIDENGFLVDYAVTFTQPNASKIVNWIEGK